MSRRRVSILITAASAVAVMSIGWLAFAQTSVAQAPSAQAPIKVSVNEVIVPVTVTDEKGRFVSNLDKADFHIFDEGREQKIDYFTRERNQPVVVGFLLDMSNAMKIHWTKYQDAASELVLNLLPGDPKFAGYLITYGNEKPELQVDTGSDSEKIEQKLKKLKPAGGAAFYDAVYMACVNRKLIQGEPYEPRRIVIVIGDGHDTASKKTLNEVIEIAQRNLVTVYGMSTVAFGFSSEGEDALTRLAEETGGRVEYPLNNLYKDVSGYLSTPSDDGNYALAVGTGGYASQIAGGIFRAVANISGEITTQYIMRYTPDIGDRGSDRVFRRIKVAVNLPGVKIRFRNGYYPAKP
jgi:VWFA-related protein